MEVATKSARAKMMFLIYNKYLLTQNNVEARNLGKKSLKKLYFTLEKWDLLWKTPGKIMEKDPERLCEPWTN